MKILALDLGKFKTVGCAYDGASGEHRFKTSGTTRTGLAQLVKEVKPDRVVIEVCNIAGWVCDLLRGMGVEVQVANTSEDAWRWRKVKKKNDRCDALKIAQLSAVNQVREVHIPNIEVRQWRALIAFRQQLVRRRGKVKNHIRDLLVSEGQILPRGAKCWTQLGQAHLEALSKDFSELGMDELWRGQLKVELRQLQELQREIEQVEEKLDAIAKTEPRLALLRTIPGVGPRLSEAIVALLDQPGRFRKGREVSAYVGMVPKELDSGETVRRGRITKHGSRLVRSLLVEVAWAGLRYNPWVRETFARISGGKKSRKKIAIVAVGRRLLVRCWAMLRDGTSWRPPVTTHRFAKT
ncbi:MAG TPA: IS110 family transposase [Pyrinomonadaceae bacterium]|nr:IS110 family transposase [Pyrinomonadaceae bacterium]